MVGTPAYTAPEVISGIGYNESCDYWSLGICFYEIACGKLPFQNSDEDDPILIYKAIQTRDVHFPKFYSDEKGKDLIVKLLDKRPER
jgi:serine/threonine protein kinase